MIVYAAESLYWFNTTEPPYLIKGLPTSLESRHTTICRKKDATEEVAYLHDTFYGIQHAWKASLLIMQESAMFV